MKRPRRFARWMLVALAAGTGCASELRLIGVKEIAAGTRAHGEAFGGISGLDYDRAADRWLAVSDDRSEHGPARFFAVWLDYDAREFRAATIEAVTVLRQPDGTTFPGKREFERTRRGEVPDFEALRIDPRDGRVWIASEGERAFGHQPFVRQFSRDGRHAGELPLPTRFQFYPAERRGPRPNLSLEALAFAPDGESLWMATEAPLFEDGPPPSETSGATIRLTRLSRTGRVLAQSSYPAEPIALAPATGRLANAGVSEILALPDGRLLVLERCGAQNADGSWAFAARLYVADASGADSRPAPKRLVLDFARVGAGRIDNLEAIAWGRTLPSGNATLVVASDDNFLSSQSTQFWVFEVPATFPL